MTLLKPSTLEHIQRETERLNELLSQEIQAMQNPVMENLGVPYEYEELTPSELAALSPPIVEETPIVPSDSETYCS